MRRITAVTGINEKTTALPMRIFWPVRSIGNTYAMAETVCSKLSGRGAGLDTRKTVNRPVSELGLLRSDVMAFNGPKSL